MLRDGWHLYLAFDARTQQSDQRRFLPSHIRHEFSDNEHSPGVPIPFALCDGDYFLHWILRRMPFDGEPAVVVARDVE